MQLRRRRRRREDDARRKPRTNLEIEGTVDPVLLCPEDVGQMFRHGEHERRIRRRNEWGDCARTTHRRTRSLSQLPCTTRPRRPRRSAASRPRLRPRPRSRSPLPPPRARDARLGSSRGAQRPPRSPIHGFSALRALRRLTSSRGSRPKRGRRSTPWRSLACSLSPL